MSSAVLFLVVALAGATVASLILWLFSNFPRTPEPDYQDQLRAIAPTKKKAVEQPSGIVPLDPLPDEES